MRPLIIIVGPTAVGKTDVAMALQDALGGPDKVQLISADSAMVYRGMDIGSAKPSARELRDHPHALIDIRDPDDPYTVADFVSDADHCIEVAFDNDQLPILVGGTMLYVKRFIEGIAELPSADAKLREQMEAELASKGAQTLHAELAAIDAQAASHIHPNNHQRLLRALEVVRTTGKPLTQQWQVQAGLPVTQRLGVIPHVFGIMPDSRERLHERIAQRFDQMLDAGFLEELERLHARAEIHSELPAMRSVGYRQGLQYLNDELSQVEFRDKAIVATRRLAKRQLTWLRQWPDLVQLNWGDPIVLAQQIQRQVGL